MPYQDEIDSAFDPSVSSYDDETLPLDEIIRLAVEAGLSRARVALPCVIVKINGTQNVDLQPLLQSRYRDGTVVNMPIIPHALVSMPQGADFSIKLPLAVGDTGYAIFCDRSLDNWSASDGGIVDPQDSRQHDLVDPVFYPGLVPFSKQISDSTTDLVITNGSAQARFQKAGTFLVKGASSELLDLLVQVTTQLQTLSAALGADTVNTQFGPMQLNDFSTYKDVGQKLEDLLGKLTAMKGT